MNKNNSTPTSPQRQYYSQQDSVAPDVPKLFNSIIKNIDGFRSYFFTDETTSSHIQNKDLDNLLAIGGGTQQEYQESRAHAFYRMMGLPVLNEDGSKAYSPGHDPSLNKDEVRLDKNLDIAISFIKQFGSVSTDRELDAKNNYAILSASDEAASVAAVATMFPRSLDRQLTPDLLPTDFDSQTFEVESRSSLQLEYPNSTVKTNVRHILKPFVVDPRIELTVSPAQNRICAPFLENKSKTQITKNNFLKRPYIERVISVRFKKTNITQDNKVNNQYIKDISAFIHANSTITSESLNQLAGPDLQKLHQSELLVTAKFIKLIESLIGVMVDNILTIEKLKTMINYKPIPSKNGLENGLTLNKVDYSDANNKLIETEIWTQNFNKRVSETDFNAGYSKPDVNSFAFSGVDDMIFGGEKDDKEFFDKQIKQLSKKRDEHGDLANACLSELEMLLGEFSGLGLLDVLIIQSAFWLISPEALLGLIDDAAIARMQANQQLLTELAVPGARLTPLNSLKEFEKKVSEMYVLTWAFYGEILAGESKNKK